MRNHDLAARLGHKLGMSVKDANRVLSLLGDVVREALEEGDEVRLPKVCRLWPQRSASYHKMFMGRPFDTRLTYRIRCTPFPSLRSAVCRKLLAAEEGLEIDP